MNLTLESLQIVDAIARKGSFAAAAEALDKVPSAITYVRKLEDDLDVLLFDRRGHKARLTEAGEELLLQGGIAASGAATGKSGAAHRQGWEAEFRIVIDGIIRFDDLIPLIREFEQQEWHPPADFAGSVVRRLGSHGLGPCRSGDWCCLRRAGNHTHAGRVSDEIAGRYRLGVCRRARASAGRDSRSLTRQRDTGAPCRLRSATLAVNCRR
jgi:hypothetical protein